MIGQLWRSFSLRTKGLIVALIPLVALLLSSSLFFTLQREEQKAQQQVEHSLEVRDELHHTQALVEESETRLRGYLLSGNQNLLKKSLETQESLISSCKTLKKLVLDNPIQAEKAKRIESLAKQKIALSKQTIAKFLPLTEPSSFSADIEQSRVVLDQLRDEFLAMETEEERLSVVRTNKARHARFLVGVVITTGSLIGVLGGLAASVFFTLGLDQRIRKLDRQAHALAEGQPISVSDSVGYDTISSLEQELGRTSALLIERQSNLHETNEQLNHLVSSMPGVLIRLNKNFRVQYASPNASRVFGYEIEEIVGNDDFYSQTLHPEDRNRIMVGLTRAIIEKIPLIEIEGRVLHPNGVYHWMHSYMRPEYDEKGQVMSLLCYSVDVTELKRTQEALRESETLFRNSFDFAPIGIVLMTLEGKWLMANRAMCDIVGYTEEEFLKIGLQEVTHPDDYEDSIALRDGLIDGTVTVTESEKRYIHRNGHIVWVQLNVSLVRDAEGEPLYFIGQIQDISERKRIEVELAQARDAALESARAKASFLANMSHEIRTPMNGIFGMIGLLGNTRLDVQQKDFVDTMRESADALLVIINDILDFSKIEAGKMEMEKTNFDLNVTVESSIGLLAAKSRTRGVELGSIIYREVPTLIRGDAGRLRQILLNLLDNAIKFTPDGGDAMLRVTRENESDAQVVLNFSISDSGIGIDEDAQMRLFQPFAQADGSTTRRYGGTGLGLAICKQLVELMGGTIGVRSRKGEGATFWFTASFEKQSNPTAIAAREKADMSKWRVLIVDSNESHRLIVQQQVASWNFSSDSVSKGSDALERLHREVRLGSPFHIVLISRQLEDMDSLTLVRTIRTLPLVSETRLIVMTQPEDQADEIRNAGADDVLTKPIRQSQLFNSLTEVMEKRRVEPVQSHIQQEVVTPIGVNTNPLHILVAEDNAINQKVVTNQLKNLGHTSFVVNTGIEAIDAWKAHKFDLILMDCHMPDMDGYEASREIRTQENSGQHIPIIALTANALNGDRELCIAAGMDDYLPKPVNQTDLDKILLRMSLSQNQSTHEHTHASIDDIEIDLDALDHERLDQLQTEISPHLFQNVVEMFLEEAPQLIGELNQVWQNKDSFQMSEIAHKLKGSCATLGANRMSHLCENIQSLAEENELEKIAPLLTRIDEEFVPVKMGLNKYIPITTLSSFEGTDSKLRSEEKYI